MKYNRILFPSNFISEYDLTLLEYIIDKIVIKTFYVLVPL